MDIEWLTLGRVFVYDFVDYRQKRKRLHRKLVRGPFADFKVPAGKTPKELYGAEAADFAIEGRVPGNSTYGTHGLSDERLERGTHFGSNHGGYLKDDTCEMIFPRRPFAALKTKGSTRWQTSGGDGKNVTLKRFAAKPYKVKIDGKIMSLPAVGARCAEMTLLLLDDDDFPLVLERNEPPEPEKLVEIVSPKGRKTAKSPTKSAKSASKRAKPKG